MYSSVICSTYNTPRFLELVLDSLLYQDTHQFELLIADDGSQEETKKLIEDFQKKAPFKIVHLWHEDLGWRKSQIHNMAIARASYDHLIFIDGDCVLAPGFIRDHQSIFEQEKENYVLMGRRVELGEKLTATLTVQNYRSKLMSPLSLALLFSCAVNDSRAYMRKFSFHNSLLRKIYSADKVNDLLGCNFSLNKKSMLLINGFNDDYQRGEDGDIFVRLRNTNHKLIGKKYFAVMFHLYHGRGNYQYVDDNYEKIIQIRDYVRAENGLNKYLSPIS